LREDWPQEILDSEEGKEILDSRGEVLYRGLSVRMGIHWGAPVCEADPITRRMDYFGPMCVFYLRFPSFQELTVFSRPQCQPCCSYLGCR
jgi:hypothetical protein